MSNEWLCRECTQPEGECLCPKKEKETMTIHCENCGAQTAEPCLCPKKGIVKVPCPLGKRVMLVKDEAPETSEGGIVIPDNSREKPLTAHVIAVGDEVTKLSKGDEVVFASFAGTEFNIGGQEVIVVDEEDIMLVLREFPTEKALEDCFSKQYREVPDAPNS